MTITIFKILLTPALIWVVSLAGRKWGAAVSGLLIGLPLTSGPVAVFIAMERGPVFARQTASGILLGGLSVAGFCLAYGWLAARRHSWPVALLVGWGVTVLATAALDQVHVSGLVALSLIVVGLLALIWLMPPATDARAAGEPPWWDLPARIGFATIFVIGLTALAPLFGAQLSGLLATLPIYASILAGFNHYLLGPEHAVNFTRGLAVGLFGFVAFFAIVEAMIMAAPVWATFSAAAVVALATQATLMWLTRQRATRESVAAAR